MTSTQLKSAVCLAQVVTGRWVYALNRVMVGFLALGIVFTLGFMPISALIENPETQLQVQAFQINYYEMVKSRQDTGIEAQDPDWDGVLSGMTTGYALTRNMPFVLPMMGALVGAAVGYQLDSRI